MSSTSIIKKKSSRLELGLIKITLGLGLGLGLNMCREFIVLIISDVFLTIYSYSKFKGRAHAVTLVKYLYTTNVE